MELAEENLDEHHLDEKQVVDVVVRFAGDSGDGMQLTGNNFTEATALYGNDLSTFPDFPAEIRAPVGATFGVSAFQIYFGAEDVTTAGDALDVLVAMNPAALTTNIANLVDGGLLIVDSGAFTAKNLTKAKYQENPLEDGSLEKFRVLEIDITKQVLAAVEEFNLGHKAGVRSKNMWTLGLVLWLFDRDRTATIESLKTKFASKPEIASANIAALNAGHAYGETAELPAGIHVYKVPKAKVAPGTYRNMTGTNALAWGLIAGSELANIDMLFASYPITPASNLLHELVRHREFDINTFQAEDEIAAVCAAIGASFAGSLGVTSSAGPGIALKAEGIALACATELPLVIVNTQRGGPSTGLPTKTEQSDLNMALHGRHGDTPMPVIASSTSIDCFDVAIEAVRLATKYMTPVMLLSDGYLANAAEPWKIPDMSEYKSFPVKHYAQAEGFKPSLRNEDTLARVWAKPGTAGLEHRIGGIERSFDTGDISYDPANHQKMTDLRKAKIAGIANDIPLQEVCLGNEKGKLAVVGWGSTFGAIHQAVKRARAEGLDASHIHVRYLSPLPRNLGELLAGFDSILVPELNTGQFVQLLRSEFLVDAEALNKVAGQPFKIGEILAAIHEKLAAAGGEIMNQAVPKLTLKDYASDQEVRWCPGCGDYAILKTIQKLMPQFDQPKENQVFISGIGCSSRFPYYMNTFGFHTIHGRAPAVATGVKLANPELDVWVVTGDGDGFSIGGNHMLHVLRRNVDLQILLFNNEIYGLTKGQYSPTSQTGTRSPSSPSGSIDLPLSPCEVALGSGGTFIARTIDTEAKHLGAVVTRGHDHKGSSFIEILQNCPIYNDGVFDQLKDKKIAADYKVELVHGEPIVFGKEREQGIRLNHDSLKLELVDATSEEVLVHDETNKVLATMLATMKGPDFPVAVGVIYREEKSSYVDDSQQQLISLRAAKGSIKDLLHSGHTWEVE